MNSLIPTWKKLIVLGLEEDAAAFDWTARTVARASHISGKNTSPTQATLVAKAAGIWAGETGLKAVELVSQEMGSPLTIQSSVKDGQVVQAKTKICEWTGAAETILVFERTLINLASYASGIATQTQALVQKIAAAGLKNPPRLAPTRKTIPGYRDLAIQSTLIGGAFPHRFNLSGGLLLKENHLAAAGGIAAAVAAARLTAPHLLKIEIEVRNLDELKEAIQAEADVIMLDNFSPAQIREAISLKPARGVLYEASGGISGENIASYAIEGLDVISVGSITHSVQSLDLSLLMNSVK